MKPQQSTSVWEVKESRVDKWLRNNPDLEKFIGENLINKIGISGSYPDIYFGITAFNNYIQNFIYEDQRVDAQGNPVVIVPGNKTFQHQQTNAKLYGMDISSNIHPQVWKGFYFNNAVNVAMYCLVSVLQQIPDKEIITHQC